jgi:uncharacterized phage protein (TIGR01671 family)
MNSRELKFRIWHLDKKKWLTNNDYIGINNFGVVVDDRDDMYNLSLADGCIIQQYTGLKDKNGIPICEGDIVKYARIKVESTEFAKGCFSSKAIEIGEEIGEILFIKPSFCLSFDHIRYDDIMPMSLAEHRYEVIGNIMETPELIKNNDNNNQ